MASSPLASLLATNTPGPTVNTSAPLQAATTGYGTPQAPPTTQAVSAAPKAPVVQVPSLALAAAAKQTPGPNLTATYAKIGAKAKAAAAGQLGTSAPGNQNVPNSPAGPSPHGIVAAAKTMLGTPYVWGGTQPGKALDCSGFVQAAYAKIGITIPRTTYAQYAAGQPVNLKNAQPGDLIFVEPQSQGPGHVGMLIAPGLVQESPHKGTTNTIVPLASFLQDGFVGVRRF